MPHAQSAFFSLSRGQQLCLDAAADSFKAGNLSGFDLVQRRKAAPELILIFLFGPRLRGVVKANTSTGSFALHYVQYAKDGGWETLWGPRGRRTVSLATWIAGPRRSHLREEWTAILAGDADNGVFLSSRRRFTLAAGFCLAAIRMRTRDLVRPLWRPVDWLLSTDQRTNGFIATIVGGQAIYIVDDGGIPALVTEIWEPCGILGAGLYVLARWLRRMRGIELATAPSSPEES